jgi:hypothetical protein
VPPILVSIVWTGFSAISLTPTAAAMIIDHSLEDFPSIENHVYLRIKSNTGLSQLLDILMLGAEIANDGNFLSIL